MKKIFYTFTLLYTFFGNAQTPILNVHTKGVPDIENAYYKDIENFYNQFVGTWVYTDGNKTIRFKFIKKEMFYYQSSTGNYYEDFLVGEMQYFEGGIQKLNSLSNLNINHSSIFEYNIYSGVKVGYHWYPTCLECPSDVERLTMFYDEPTNDDMGLEAAFVMRRVTENGVQKLKIQYIITNGAIGINKNNPELLSITSDFKIPYGDYTLIKEN